MALCLRSNYEVHILLNNRVLQIKGVTAHKIDEKTSTNVHKIINKIEADIIVNCAGYTDVDGCEDNPEKSREANVEFASVVASAAEKSGAKLVHISTDHLFDGTKSFASEQCPPNPLNVYAQHKFEAEEVILKSCPDALICRTNFVCWGPTYRASFIDNIIYPLRNGKVTHAFDDVFFTPVSVSQLVEMMLKLISKNEKGIFNLSNNERVSKYEFATRLSQAFSLESSQIQPVQAFRRKNRAIRPFDLSLSNDLVRQTIKIVGYDIASTIADLGTEYSQIDEILSIGKTLPYGRHHIDEEDIRAVENTLRGGILTQGPMIEKFEQRLADYTGSRYAVAVSSATAGLHLSYLALGLSKGKSVLTSPITFVATANAAHFCGGNARFADIDSKTKNISYSTAKIAIQKHPDIHIVAPVLFGGATDGMVEVMQLAKKSGKLIVEDAAHALGASYPCGSKVGSCSYSDCTVFSLHPVKSIAAGEGGVITTNNEQIFRRLLRLRSHGINKMDDKFLNLKNAYTEGIENLWYYEMTELGFHYRITDLQAALALSQLAKIDTFMKRREELVNKYQSYFGSSERVSIAQHVNVKNSANHIFPIAVDFGQKARKRNQLMQRLRNRGIITQVHYIPVVMQPFYQSLGEKARNYPESLSYYDKCLSLPLYYGLSDADQKKVIEALFCELD